MTTILAPIDFSAVTPRVVAEAVELARIFVDGRLVLLNVSRPDFLADDQAAFHRLMEELVEHPLESTGSRNSHARDGNTTVRPVHGDSLQLNGDPVEVILQEAKALDADYIVIGSHGRSALHDLVFGSVAAGLLKNAPCPIVIVPSRMDCPPRPVKRRAVRRTSRLRRAKDQGSHS